MVQLAVAHGHEAFFPDGSITKIVFKDFLTYDSAEVKPGPHMNVIIGPNGTGKSTIICGICLALGGKPTVLGRSTTIGDYIKHGKESGSVEVYLKDSRFRQERKFKILIKKPSTAKYFVDDKHVSHNDIQATVSKYNIQVDNPCTFLAQDKVKSFAEQGPQVLLQNTEKAGPVHLLKMHNKLLEFAKAGDDSERLRQDHLNRLKQLTADLMAKKKKVDNFLERQKRHERVAILRRKKIFLNYEACMEESRDKMADLDHAEAELQAANATVQPLQQRINALEQKCRQLEAKLQDAKRAKRDMERKRSDLMSGESVSNEINRIAEDFTRVRHDYENWNKQQVAAQRHFEETKHLYEQAQRDMASQPSSSSAEAHNPQESAAYSRKRKEELKKEHDEIQQEMDQLTRAKNELNRRKGHEKSIFDMKMKRLQSFAGAARIREAWDFYQNNRDKFQYEVFVPFLSMTVHDRKDLIYLGNILGNRDLSLFVFGSRDDEQIMLGGGNPFKISSTVVDENLIDSFSNRARIDPRLKELGFRCLATDLFDAPTTVTTYFRSVMKLDNILIGDHRVDERTEEIGNQIGRDYGLFLTDRTRVQVQFSRYGTNSYVKRSPLRQNHHLINEHTIRFQTADQDRQSIRQKETEINKKKEMFDQKMREFNARMEELKSAEKERYRTEAKVASMKDKMEASRTRLLNMQRGKPNIEAARSGFEEKKRVLMDESLKNFVKLTKLVDLQRTQLQKAIFDAHELSRYKQMIINYKAENENRLSEIQGLQEAYDTKKQQVEEVRSRIKALKKDFYEACDVDASRNVDERALFAQQKKIFQENNVPESEAEVDDAIVREQSRLNVGSDDGTRRDVEDYERLKQEEAHLREGIETANNRRERWQEEMDQRLQAWLDPLRETVGKINGHYKHFFERLGCAGAVELHVPEEKYRLEEYGIKIYVKFREQNQLRLLDHQVQSGGERSVATMLYLMALQELCPVPFRCVDEINQGMDPNNERRVFEMMLEMLSTNENLAKTQYFLLTPKLLTGLKYNDRVMIHLIHNSPTLVNAHLWDPYKCIDYLRRPNALHNGH